MKIRHGFVSNSSSSSFCIFGTRLFRDEIIELAIKLNLISEQKASELARDDYETPSELLNSIQKKLGREFNHIYSWESEYGLIGKPWETMKQNETRKEFETKVKTKFKELGLPKPDFICQEVSH
jgi:hypothetical protein